MQCCIVGAPMGDVYQPIGGVTPKMIARIIRTKWIARQTPQLLVNMENSNVRTHAFQTHGDAMVNRTVKIKRMRRIARATPVRSGSLRLVNNEMMLFSNVIFILFAHVPFVILVREQEMHFRILEMWWRRWLRWRIWREELHKHGHGFYHTETFLTNQFLRRMDI